MMQEGWFPERGLYYRTNAGAGSGRAIVFIHGVSGSSLAWERFEQHFMQTHTIVSLDLRGHGRSRKYSRSDAYTLSAFASDVHALLRHLALEEYILVSHSFGSLVALEYLSRYSSEVSAAILVSPTIESTTQLPLRLARIPLQTLSFLFSHIPFSENPGVHIDYRAVPDRGDWDLRRRFVDIRNTSLHVYLHAMSHIYDIGHVKDYSRIRMPILILHGDHDTLFPIAKSQRLSELLPNARFEAIEGADHILLLNSTDAVLRAMDRFISDFA